MMGMRVGAAVAMALALVGGSAFAVARQDVTGPAGQLVFVPVPSLDELVGEGPVVQIESCRPSPGGLEVAGHVHPTGTAVIIRVSQGSSDDPGVRVGAAYQADARRLPGEHIGDFEVVLPWGEPRSRFAVASPTTPGVSGPAVGCP